MDISSVSERRTGLIVVLALLILELAAIGSIYKHIINFDCLENWPGHICRGASGLMVSVYTMTGALVIFAWLLPGPVSGLVSKAGPRKIPLTLNLVGLAAVLAPLPLMEAGSGTSALYFALSFWAVGVAFGATGAVLMLAPARRWKAFFKEYGAGLSFTVLAGLLAPIVAIQIRPFWQEFEGLANLTFSTSAWIIQAFGYAVEIRPETKVIGSGDFLISVAPVCSGIEGMALVATFVTIYFVLFRKELSFPRALVLYPIGIIASAGLNIVRIVALLAIGIGGAPELAVGGFHSHAGWLMFTILAVALVFAANSIAWFHSDKRTAPTLSGKQQPLPFLQDPIAAQIFPFIVFMASALVAQTFSNVPGLAYPLRFLAMCAAVVVFWPIYQRMPWRPDLTSILCGAGVGILWLATAQPAEQSSDLSVALAGLGGLGLGVWIFCRVAGTVVLVPLIEELFFRGYLFDAVKGEQSKARLLLALIVTSVLFGALHDRWLAGGLAGIAFGLLRMRHGGHLTDAVLAHSVANAIIAAAAVARSDWSLI